MTHSFSHPATIALALLATTLACSSTTESSMPSKFDATVDGAVRASVSGSATISDSYDRQVAVAFPGAPGANMTVIGLSANKSEHVVSLTVPTAQLSPRSYQVRALNAPSLGAGQVAAHAGYVHRMTDERLQFFQASSGEVVIDSVANGRAFGRFSLHADAYDVLPPLRTLTNNAPVTPLAHGTQALDMSGTFAAVQRR